MDQKCRDRVVLGQVPDLPGSSTGKESAYSPLPTYIVTEGSYAFQSGLSLRTPKPRCNTEVLILRNSCIKEEVFGTNSRLNMNLIALLILLNKEFTKGL